MKELRGMGIDQETAVLVEGNGAAKVVGKGAAYFLRAGGKPARVKAGEALEFGPVAAVKVTVGGRFDVKAWTGDAAVYAYTVSAGVVKTSRAGAGFTNVVGEEERARFAREAGSSRCSE